MCVPCSTHRMPTHLNLSSSVVALKFVVYLSYLRYISVPNSTYACLFLISHSPFTRSLIRVLHRCCLDNNFLPYFMCLASYESRVSPKNLDTYYYPLSKHFKRVFSLPIGPTLVKSAHAHVRYRIPVIDRLDPTSLAEQPRESTRATIDNSSLCPGCY